MTSASVAEFRKCSGDTESVPGRVFRGHNTKLSPLLLSYARLRLRGGVAQSSGDTILNSRPSASGEGLGWGLAYRSASRGRRDPTPLRLGSKAAKSHCPALKGRGNRVFISTLNFRHPELVSGPIFRPTRSLVFGRNPYSLRLFGQLRASGMMGPETSSG